MKKLFLTLLFLMITCVGVGFYYYKQYEEFIGQPVFDKSRILTIKKGQTFKGFTSYIKENHANGKPWQWRLFAKMEKVGQWLKVGEFSEPVKTNFGYHIIKAINKSEESYVPFDKVKEYLTTNLQKEQLGKAVKDMIDAEKERCNVKIFVK